jgi:hypothetical protein
MLLSFEVLRVASIKKTAFWDVINLMLEAISTAKRQSLSLRLHAATFWKAVNFRSPVLFKRGPSSSTYLLIIVDRGFVFFLFCLSKRVLG